MEGLNKMSIDLEQLAKEHELYENPMTDKQRDILAAAEKLFSAAGYSDTSTASIAKEAGVTEKTLFKHFPTKQDLLRRILFPLLLKTVVPIQMKIVKNILQKDYKTYKDFFTGLAVDRWQTARQLGSKLKLVIGELAKNDKLRDQLFNLASTNVYPELIKNIERYQKSGELRSDLQAEDIARLQVSTIIANALLRGVIAPKTHYNDEKDARMIADMLLNGIGTKTSKN